MQRLVLANGAHFELDPRWIERERAQALFDALLTEVPWAQREIELYGRKVMQPRLVAWVGDPEAVYTYSRTRHVPLPWTPTLAALRREIELAVDRPFNSVLCNLYRDGHDSMGMHADREPELGPDPLVASLSLGATRRFVLRHRDYGKQRAAAADGELAVDLELESGSLLVMNGATQHVYKHGVPKQPSIQAARINLTFRWVQGVQAANVP
ncbi:MAG: alpha-ketoglutarate-dependent dioxygenase AlkB [Myxococcales bacterium]